MYRYTLVATALVDAWLKPRPHWRYSRRFRRLYRQCGRGFNISSNRARTEQNRAEPSVSRRGVVI